MPPHSKSSLLLLLSLAASASAQLAEVTSAQLGGGSSAGFDCPEEQVSFEMVTGFVYTAPADMLDSQPGMLMLTDCIDTCRGNSSCMSINYETGLCVLFSSSADENDGQLTPSQFPVFTIYVQKTCLASAPSCDAAWSFERVMDYELQTDVRKRGRAGTRAGCMELCLAEPEFKCRSAMYDSETGDCRLLDQDRHTMAGLPTFTPKENNDYLEINCVNDEPKKLCLYDQVKGKILKTVDSVHQAIASKEDCENLCNEAPFRCHSYDYNDIGDSVCRLSHHSGHTVTQIEEPYLAIEEATTYELVACYNVTIECKSGDMTAFVKTSSLFNGKVYAKGSPVNCMVDVDNSLDFSITMAYNDLECGVERVEPGVYNNEVVVQHHDRIVTSDDLGLDLTCQYDLTNKSVSNTVDLTITGEIAPSLYEESVVDSPNVIMRVEDVSGANTKTATVGDPLSLVFEILDEDSPYEIFVRDLVALDGATDTELLLIDARGCPADPTIMSEMRRSESNNKTLLSSFDAFRFPTSQMVQFRALVTPCMPTCEPVVCDILDYTGQTRNVESYGRKKRWTSVIGDYVSKRTRRTAVETEMEEVLVVNSIQIVDKNDKKRRKSTPRLLPAVSNSVNRFNDNNAEEAFATVEISTSDNSGSRCIDDTSLIAGAIIFLVVQVFLLIMWTLVWKRKRSEAAKEVIMRPENTHDSLSYIYETGLARRMQ